MEAYFTSDGWDGIPNKRTASGGEYVYRAFDEGSSATSIMHGRFFVMPVASGIALHQLSALELERELNAALWGNRFSNIAKFRLKQGTPYLVGNIAHTDYIEKSEKEGLFHAISFITPSGIFKQIKLEIGEKGNVEDAVTLVDRFRVKGAYRFVQGNGVWN